MKYDVVPAEDLIALIQQLRRPPRLPKSPALRRYMEGVAQGREQAATRIEDLLIECGVTPERKKESDHV